MRIGVVGDTHNRMPNVERMPPDLSLLLHGHTHRHRLDRQGETLIFNPGECAGLRGGGNAVGLVDLISLEANRLRF